MLPYESVPFASCVDMYTTENAYILIEYSYAGQFVVSPR